LDRSIKNLWGLLGKKSMTVSSPLWYFLSNGDKVLVNDSKGEYIGEGFGSNSTVYSIIKHISDKFATLPFYLYETKDKKEFNRYKCLSQGLSSGGSLIEYERARKKALREVDTHPFLDAFDALGFEGKAQLCGFRDMSGDAFLWKVKGLSGSAPIAYKILPSQFMNIDADGTLDGVKGYRLNIGKGVEFQVEEIGHWKHWNPFFGTAGEHLYGLSPLRAGFVDLMTSKAGKNAAYNDFKNNGVRGAIVRNEDIPWSPEIRDQTNTYLDEKFNGADNRGRIRAINMKASWMQMGLSSAEMDTMKALQLTKEDLCNVFSFPVRLLAGVEGTFNNVDSSGKQLVTNCVYPRAVSFRDFVNSQLLPDFGAQGLFYDVDISALPEMQDEMKMLADVLNTLPLTLNEIRTGMGYDEIADANMDKVYITSNKSPIDQINQPMQGDISGDANTLNQQGANDY
jgi:phage portal protein BeeE